MGAGPSRMELELQRGSMVGVAVLLLNQWLCKIGWRDLDQVTQLLTTFLDKLSPFSPAQGSIA